MLMVLVMVFRLGQVMEMMVRVMVMPLALEIHEGLHGTQVLELLVQKA